MILKIQIKWNRDGRRGGNVTRTTVPSVLCAKPLHRTTTTDNQRRPPTYARGDYRRRTTTCNIRRRWRWSRNEVEVVEEVTDGYGRQRPTTNVGSITRIDRGGLLNRIPREFQRSTSWQKSTLNAIDHCAARACVSPQLTMSAMRNHRVAIGF